MQELTMTPSTVVLLILIAAWAVWAVRRLFFRGLCDCHGCSTCNISIPESPEQK